MDIAHMAGKTQKEGQKSTAGVQLDSEKIESLKVALAPKKKKPESILDKYTGDYGVDAGSSSSPQSTASALSSPNPFSGIAPSSINDAIMDLYNSQTPAWVAYSSLLINIVTFFLLIVLLFKK